MSDTIIKIENLSKRYRIGAKEGYKTFRETIVDAARAPVGKLSRLFNRTSDLRPPTSDSIWALKDVSFQVNRGEVVGIIGRNGAGKSTLLKILSKITEPTSGRVELRGRVGSLLEVGTGFHPELSGHENIYLYGAILGMDRWEVTRKFDEIVAFAELEKFIDTAVKRYSSGMYMRLAFAVAAHLEPEVLLIDEVLAVGDAAFQKKCIGKMGDVAHEGRTVLFISHNMAAVDKLCKRGIVLDQGHVEFIGTTTGAISNYLSSVEAKPALVSTRSDRRGTGELRVVNIVFRDVFGHQLDAVRSGQDIDIYLHYETINMNRKGNVVASIMVRTQLDVPVFLQHNRLTSNHWESIPDRAAFVCRLHRLPLPPAVYRLGFSVLHYNEYLDAISDAVEMTVREGDFFGSGEVPPISHGCCLVNAKWRIVAV
jgi:lipopolysaccharide transport system ATP-binding protein